MTTLGTEFNVEALNKAALDTIGKAEALLNEGKFEEAKQVYFELDAIEKRRDELGEAETMRARMARDKAKAAAPAQPMRHSEPLANDPGGRRIKTPGEMFIEHAVYMAALQARAFDSQQFKLPDISVPINYSLLQLKTLVLGNSVSGGGAFVINDFQPGYVDLRQRPTTVLDIINRVRTSSDTVDWVKETAFTNNAVFVAEATSTTGTSGTKPESAINYERVTAAVETLAHWIPITNRALSDAPQMQDIINGRLLTGLDLSLESQVLTGNGTSPNISGLTNQGIMTLALGTNSTIDAILRATVQIEVSGLVSPTDVVMHPTEWLSIRLARENATTGTLGQYLMGPPSVPGPMTVFGLPVVKSLGITDGSAIVGAFTPETHALFDREQAVVRMGYIDQMFVRNMVALLAELRAAFAVFRPNGFCLITGLT